MEVEPIHSNLQMKYNMGVVPKPMLAKKVVSFDDVLINEHLIAQRKFDGERLLCMIYQKECKYFTRNLHPCNINDKVIINDAEFVILDGERMYANENDYIPLAKVKSKKSLRDVYLVFDILQINNESLLDYDFLTRQKLLRNHVVQTNYCKIVPFEFVHSISELESKFKSVIDDGGEGLMIKYATDTYLPGTRHWLKIKALHLPQYRLEKRLNVIQCLRDKKNEYGIINCGEYVDGKLIPICKVGVGISDQFKLFLNLRVNSNGIPIVPIIALVAADQNTQYNSLRHPKLLDLYEE